MPLYFFENEWVHPFSINPLKNIEYKKLSKLKKKINLKRMFVL